MLYIWYFPYVYYIEILVTYRHKIIILWDSLTRQYTSVQADTKVKVTFGFRMLHDAWPFYLSIHHVTFWHKHWAVGTTSSLACTSICTFSLRVYHRFIFIYLTSYFAQLLNKNSLLLLNADLWGHTCADFLETKYIILHLCWKSKVVDRSVLY